MRIAGEGIEVAWRAYQLYPDLPAAGVDRKAFMRARFGEGQDRSAMSERLQAEAADVGLTLDFGRIQTLPNTFAAHRLLVLAERYGCQHELAEVLFQYYFQRGRNVGDPAELQAAAEAVGMDGGTVAAFLAGDEAADSVREQLQMARLANVTGVPFYVLAGSFGIPGAQSVETFTQVIGRVKERLAERSA